MELVGTNVQQHSLEEAHVSASHLFVGVSAGGQDHLGPGAAGSRSAKEVVEDRGVHGLHTLRVELIVVGLDLGAHERVRRVGHDIDQGRVVASELAQGHSPVDKLGQSEGRLHSIKLFLLVTDAALLHNDASCK